jgi:hypothetical protein
MATDVNVTEDMMDFSLPPRNLKFKVDNDIFEAVPELATEQALRFADDAEVMEDESSTAQQRLDVVKKLFHLVLLPESAERLIARLSDPANPIGPERFQKILMYLMEQYGLRPTEPDEDSLSGSEVRANGTSLTESVSATA